ncbi:hypothetical protein V6N13_088850 [Hibiscus sabdariffa]
MVSGGVQRKVRSVNELVLAGLSGKQRAVLLKAQGRKKGRKAGKVGQRELYFANESLTNSDFQARQRALLREAKDTGL